MQASTLKRWLDGATLRNVRYPPVIRPEPTGSSDVTWAEFVEAGFLRGYRNKGVSLQRIRPFIDAMREAYGVQYPLAHFKPLVDVSTKELLQELKRLEDQVDLDETLALVRVRSGQLIMTEPMASFLDRVEFDRQGVAERMHTIRRADPVVIDPNVAFGAPQVRGVRTELLAEALAAGESTDYLAQAYDLTSEEVMAAVRWELRIRSKARAA